MSSCPPPSSSDVPDENAIRFHCLSCGHAIAVAKKYAGRKGRCKSCGNSVEIPQEAKADVAVTKSPERDIDRKMVASQPQAAGSGLRRRLLYTGTATVVLAFLAFGILAMLGVFTSPKGAADYEDHWSDDSEGEVVGGSKSTDRGGGKIDFPFNLAAIKRCVGKPSSETSDTISFMFPGRPGVCFEVRRADGAEGFDFMGPTDDYGLFYLAGVLQARELFHTKESEQLTSLIYEGVVDPVTVGRFNVRFDTTTRGTSEWYKLSVRLASPTQGHNNPAGVGSSDSEIRDAIVGTWTWLISKGDSAGRQLQIRFRKNGTLTAGTPQAPIYATWGVRNGAFVRDGTQVSRIHELTATRFVYSVDSEKIVLTRRREKESKDWCDLSDEGIRAKIVGTWIATAVGGEKSPGLECGFKNDGTMTIGAPPPIVVGSWKVTNGSFVTTSTNETVERSFDIYDLTDTRFVYGGPGGYIRHDRKASH